MALWDCLGMDLSPRRCLLPLEGLRAFPTLAEAWKTCPYDCSKCRTLSFQQSPAYGCRQSWRQMRRAVSLPVGPGKTDRRCLQALHGLIGWHRTVSRIARNGI